MRLLVSDIDDFAATPADLSDVEFEGSPASVEITQCLGQHVKVSPKDDGSFDLYGVLRAPDRVTVEWGIGKRANFDVVSRHYCSIDEIKDWGRAKARNADSRGKSDMDVFEKRALAEYVAEAIMGRTFRATLREDYNLRTDGRLAQLSWPASRIITCGWELVGDGLVRANPGLRHYGWRTAPSPHVIYVAGTDERIPPDVRQAVTRLAASYLMPSSIPDRATSESTDTGGFIRYTLASEESTGYPDVDAALMRYRRSRQVAL